MRPLIISVKSLHNLFDENLGSDEAQLCRLLVIGYSCQNFKDPTSEQVRSLLCGEATFYTKKLG